MTVDLATVARALVAPCWVALATLGCSANVVSTADASATSTLALLRVERMAVATEPAAVRAQASAYFLRVQNGADAVLAARLVGAAPTLPPLGQCQPTSPLTDEGIPLASIGPIDLVDVGEVSLEAPNAKATLAARAFPDVVDLVSGVVYTTRDLLTDVLPSRGPYTFRISGSSALSAMSITGGVPGPIEDVSAGGRPLSGEPVSLARDDLSIDWRPPPGADVVYVELASSEDGALERIGCTFPNEGHAIVAAAMIPKASLQNLTVHLIHRDEVSAPGLSSSEIRFDLATSGALRFDGAHR